MSIASEITRLQNAKASLKAAINAKGGTITDETIDEYASKVSALPSPKEEETKTVTPNFASGNVVVTPTTGKVLSQVTINKDGNLIAENIKAGVTIFGITGTLATGPRYTVSFSSIFDSGYSGSSVITVGEDTYEDSPPSEHTFTNVPSGTHFSIEGFGVSERVSLEINGVNIGNIGNDSWFYEGTITEDTEIIITYSSW